MAVLRRWIIAVAILVAAPLNAQTADSSQMELGRRYTQWLYEGQTDSLFTRFSPEMRQAIPTAEAFAGMRTQVQTQLGAETEVVSERILDPTPAPGMTVYVRTARFANAPMNVNVTIVTDAEGIIHGFSVRPAPPENPTE
ncbi:hypothetical protein [Longimicrobium sp.]|uniref:hypothetical protein n=1 Tax=Longimicrobium sp. TaxID=2029185 RepID=UPI003B3A1CF5